MGILHRIKTTAIVIAALVLSTAMQFVHAEGVQMSIENTREIEKEVRASFDGLAEAAKKIDIDGYFAFIDSEKFVGLNGDGTNWNSFAELKALIEPSFEALQRVESLVFTNVKISVIDANTAILINEYQQTVLLKTGQTYSGAGGGTQVWSKASGKWLLVSISASNKPVTP